jgi:hypothetical protein
MSDLFGISEQDRKKSVKRGHAWVPGTGPSGETCKTCHNLVRIRRTRDYLKCGLTQKTWTHSPRTDVRASDPACKYWKPIDAPDTE